MTSVTSEPGPPPSGSGHVPSPTPTVPPTDVDSLTQQMDRVEVAGQKSQDRGGENEGSVVTEEGAQAGVSPPEIRNSAQDKGKGREQPTVHQSPSLDPGSNTPIEAGPGCGVEQGPSPTSSTLERSKLPSIRSNSPQPTPTQPPQPQSRSAEEQLSRDEWLLKTIHWPPLPPPPSSATGRIEPGPPLKIIMQHQNGPCSLVALCNCLILRGDIQITAPPSRQSVTYDELSGLVANYLLSTEHAQSGSMSAALSILPSTRYGLEVNPRFASIDGFRESATATGELALFQLSNVPLVHGWVADPQNEDEWEVVVGQCGDYDAATLLLVQAAEITGGVSVAQLELEGDDEALIAHAERMSTLNPDQSDIVRRAETTNSFLDSSSTQLTYHGLLLLSTQLAPASLSALFRNSHLSTLYRRPADPSSPAHSGPQLFTLVTDSAFVHEPDIVWESLEDVDGAASEFFDAALRPASLPRGDFVRRRADPREDEDEDGSAALARQLQREEDEEASRRRLEREERERRREWEEAQAREAGERARAEGARGPSASQGQTQEGRQPSTAKKLGKKDKDGKNCMIM